VAFIGGIKAGMVLGAFGMGDMSLTGGIAPRIQDERHCQSFAAAANLS